MSGETNNLSFDPVTETQSQKATGANTMVGQLDAAITGVITVSLGSTDTTKTIDPMDLKRASLIILDEAVSSPIAGDFTANWAPLSRGLMTFYNATAYVATLKATTGPTSTVKVGPGGFAYFYIAASFSYTIGQPSTSYIKQPVRVATTANITTSTDLNVGDTIDGVTLVDGDRVLVKDQSTASQNGIWIAGATPSRATDWDDAGDAVSGTIIAVQEGSTNANTAFMLTTDTFPIVPGTTNVAFAQFGGGGGGGGSSPGHPAPVRAATTGNITISTALNNGDTLDGVTLVTGDRVLVKDQTTGSENGIYVVGASPARASDFDTDTTEVISGAMLFVSEGTVNQGKVFALSTTGAITTGSTSIAFKEVGTYKPPYTVGVFFSGTPDVSTSIFEHKVTYAIDIAANLSGSYGYVVTNPSGTTDFDLQKNGSSIGTISVSAAGAFTLTTTSGTAKSLAAGDRLSIVTPSNLNGLGGFSFSLLATRSL